MKLRDAEQRLTRARAEMANKPQNVVKPQSTSGINNNDKTETRRNLVLAALRAWELRQGLDS